MSIVGDNIRRIRERRNICQWELAEYLGKDQRTISSWENGRRNPSNDDVRKIAKMLDVSTAEIIGRNELSENEFEYIIIDNDMSPEIVKGDTLTVNKAVEPQDGDLVVIEMQDKQKQMVRRLYRIGKMLSLLAVNPTVKPINADADVVDIKGTVTELRRKV